MALWYNFVIKANNQWCAHYFAEKYNGLILPFSPIDHSLEIKEYFRVKAFSKNLEQDEPLRKDEWWAGIASGELSRSGIASLEEAGKVDQFDNFVYGMLRNERHFEYVLSGVEVPKFSKEDLKAMLQTGNCNGLEGLVVSKELYPELGQLPIFTEFNQTHLWIAKPFNFYMKSKM